ncbi:DUF4879 domain-containing protein [Desulfobacter hydrogenophilus]|nr:DUF4879 domain-containing protein [Desulfobacter hydrogenophilus]
MRYSVDTITNSSGVVIGFYRLWDASGYEEGKFTYQNRSKSVLSYSPAHRKGTTIRSTKIFW